LAAGRIDAVVSDYYVANHVLQRHSLTHRVVTLSPEIQKVNSYIAFSKANNLLKIKLQYDEEINRMISNGTYNRIVTDSGSEVSHLLKTNQTMFHHKEVQTSSAQ